MISCTAHSFKFSSNLEIRECRYPIRYLQKIEKNKYNIKHNYFIMIIMIVVNDIIWLLEASVLIKLELKPNW